MGGIAIPYQEANYNIACFFVVKFAISLQLALLFTFSSISVARDLMSYNAQYLTNERYYNVYFYAG